MVSEHDIAELRRLGNVWDTVMADLLVYASSGDIETAEAASTRLIELDVEIQRVLHRLEGERQVNAAFGKWRKQSAPR